MPSNCQNRIHLRTKIFVYEYYWHISDWDRGPGWNGDHCAISLNGGGNNHAMKFDRKAPLTACFQCLNCYKTYKAKGPSKEEQDEAEQRALDCCGSFIQGFYVNYRRWGIQKWYGR